MPTGTVRWFGPSWGAPVCAPDNRVEVPVGKFCQDCRVKVERGDQGLMIPYAHDGVATMEPHHLNCFLDVVGLKTRSSIGSQPLTRIKALELREAHWSVVEIAKEYDRQPEEVLALLRP